MSSNNIYETKYIQEFGINNPFPMDCGTLLSPVTIAYEAYGELNAEGDNAILVCHALTGSAHAAGYSSQDPKSVGWWDSFIGKGKPLDTEKYYVICSNFLGGCNGTTGSISINPSTGKEYGTSFPQMTVRDMVRVQKRLIEFLGVNKLKTIIGGSLGGMQVLEWAVMYPETVESIIPIATSIQHSPWAIGFNELARQAIINDPDWRNGDYYHHGQPIHGFSLARQIAMMSYRSDKEFLQRFSRERVRSSENDLRSTFDPQNNYQVESYLHYQGTKLTKRFDANTYINITRAMDLHDISAGRGAVKDVLGAITIPVLTVGIDSDILYPAAEQRGIASLLSNAQYHEISSPYGHDAFLIEFGQLEGRVKNFLQTI